MKAIEELSHAICGARMMVCESARALCEAVAARGKVGADDDEFHNLGADLATLARLLADLAARAALVARNHAGEEAPPHA